MNVNERERRIITILTVFTIVFTFFGASLAYWNWETSETQRTNVAFTVTQDFTCSVDGGGNITQTDAFIAPSTCLNSDGAVSEHVIMREVTVNANIIKSSLDIHMNLWIELMNNDPDALEFGQGLSDSENFRYALTTSNTSCDSNVITEGTFNGKTDGDTITILDKSFSSTTTETYYLWIWLDSAETSSTTMNQQFNLRLNGECTNEVIAPSPNHPVLDDGMIPVTIANDGTVTTIAETDSSWYNYDNKEWANVVLVKDEGINERSYYKNNPGETVEQDDILAYYTWIPRYSYAIPEEKECSEIANVNVDDYPNCYRPIFSDEDKATASTNWFYVASSYDSTYTEEQAAADFETGYLTGTIETDFITMPIRFLGDIFEFSYTLEYVSTNTVPSSINIMWESKTSTKTTGNALGTNYRTHPAFTFGDNELDGLWVGKFETGHSTLSSSTTNNNLGCTDENCVNADGLIIKNNVVSLRYNNVSNFFYASRSMTRSSNPFGLKLAQTDSHMMKNSEWGAVAYLSHSKYGINEEIRLNSNSSYTTGCGSTTIVIGGSSNCDNQYGTFSSYPQSTTGNITGVFDMSGGSDEYVMGNYNNAVSDSGFTSMPDFKYYDLYAGTSLLNSCNNGICYGHALSETSGWYSDPSAIVYSSSPWFDRGGGYDGGVSAGAFYANVNNGSANAIYGFRSVLVVG